MYKIFLCLKDDNQHSLWKPYYKDITTIIINEDETTTEITELKEYSTEVETELEIEIQELLKIYPSTMIKPYNDLTCEITVDVLDEETIIDNNSENADSDIQDNNVEEIIGDNNGLEQTNT